MAPSDTTIIFVPGAWHGPEGFDKVASKLQKSGYQTDYVNLASVGPKEHVKDIQPDVAIIRKHVTTAIDAGQKVVLVVHSYGSVPGCEAVHGLDYASRQTSGQKGGVTHLFFMCSFIIPAGKTLIEAFGGQDLPWWSISDDKTEVNPMEPEKIFYNDMPDDLVKSSIASLKPHSYQVFHSKLQHASWDIIPSTYLYCLKDQAIPMFVQEMMVKDIAGGAGVTIRTETVDASHSPFHTKPDECAAAIQRAAELEV